MKWPVALWGTKAVVHAGAGTADHLRCAIQLLSGDVPTRTVYEHLGWRKIGDHWCYLHAGGAIWTLWTKWTFPTVEVSAPGALNNYALPQPPSGDELVAAIRSSLGILGLASDRVTVPLLGAAYRGVLAESDFCLHLSGSTGVGKTELAALAQQHYGQEM